MLSPVLSVINNDGNIDSNQHLLVMAQGEWPFLHDWVFIMSLLWWSWWCPALC